MQKAIQDATKAIQADSNYYKLDVEFEFEVSAHYDSRHDFGLTQGYYRRGSANFAIRRFQEAMDDFKQVSTCLLGHEQYFHDLLGRTLGDLNFLVMKQLMKFCPRNFEVAMKLRLRKGDDRSVSWMGQSSYPI